MSAKSQVDISKPSHEHPLRVGDQLRQSVAGVGAVLWHASGMVTGFKDYQVLVRTSDSSDSVPWDMTGFDGGMLWRVALSPFNEEAIRAEAFAAGRLSIDEQAIRADEAARERERWAKWFDAEGAAELAATEQGATPMSEIEAVAEIYAYVASNLRANKGPE